MKQLGQSEGRSDVPVLIVGGGPVGLTLAIELGYRGTPCILVQQDDGTVSHPKVGHVSVRTMEHARRWGIVRQLRDCGFPPDYVLRMVYCTSMNGHRLCAHEYPSMREALTPPVTPEKKQRCPQTWFDPILANAAERYPHVELRYQTRLLGFDQDDEGVSARLRGPHGEYLLRATYLAACDGANSGVRQALGTEMQGNPVLSRSVAIFFRAPDLLTMTRLGQAERYTFVGPEGTWGNLTVVDGSELWRLTVFGSHERIDLSRFDAAGWVRRCLANDNLGFDILSVLQWRRSQLVAGHYSSGRVFLAGDAAHTMSPTGGFGMNTGIGDAVDLGWKLSGVLSGWGGAALLDSYDRERRPIGVRNVNFSAANFHSLVSSRDCSSVLDDTPAGAEMRASLGASIKAATRSEYESLGVILGYRYENSPICADDGTPAIPDLPDQYVPNARPGARAPHVWLSASRSILDLFGRSYILLRFSPNSDEAALMEAATQAGLPLNVVDVRNEAASELYERALVLVRPDGHVAWRGEALPRDCESLVDLMRGTQPQFARQGAA